MDAKTRKLPPAVGQHGNLNKLAWYTDDVVSLANGQVVDLGELQAGSTVLGFDLIHDAWGAGTLLAIGYRYKNSSFGAAAPTALRAATDASAAVNTKINLVTPLVLEHDVIVYATLSGANSDAGPNYIHVRPEYLFTDV